MTANIKLGFELQAGLGLNSVQFERLISRSPHTYKIYSIEKKSGGVRVIAQPAKETKIIQHWLIDNLFNKLPIHECATAYKKGSSIKINAQKHVGGKFLSKFDFKNFFPSISQNDLIAHLRRYLGDTLSNEDLLWVSRVSCFKPIDKQNLSLSIGAPSSPLLSNSVMYDFDEHIDQWCKKNNVIYTRYADDLTFSFSEKNLSSELEQILRMALKIVFCPYLEINNKKTLHLSKKHQRRVTGIIINNEGQLSLGREKKRIISSMIHKFSINQLSLEDSYKLQGLLGFAKDVEPSFLISMQNKYGISLIRKIFEIRNNVLQSANEIIEI